MTEDLRIQTAVYQLLQWWLPKTERFPRVYRTTLTQRTMDAALDMHDSIASAVVFNGKTRHAYLRGADAALNRLRQYVRLITDWQWLSLSQYEYVSEMLAGIGSMLGAWIKSMKNSA